MIKSKEDYLCYLEADRLNLKCRKTLKTYLFHDVWRYQRLLRKIEYYQNCKRGPLAKLVLAYCCVRFYYLGKYMGIRIYPHVFGPGLAIAHEGTLRVHKNARVGANCRIHVCVNIGASGGSRDAPHIGNNVYIGPGAKLFGNITIADGISIGANAVVNKSFREANITIAGVPAKKVSDRSAFQTGWQPQNDYLGSVDTGESNTGESEPLMN